MGHLLPVFLAFYLNLSGIYIFTAPINLDCIPYISYVIFLTGIYFLLWDINLRPCSFRRLCMPAERAIEFVVSMLLMEMIMANFWSPLEIGFITMLPRIADFVSDLFYNYGFSCSGPCDMIQTLKSPTTLLSASYLLSIFFFVCIIHATRVVDFRILVTCGMAAFIHNIIQKSKKSYTKFIKTIMPASCDNRRVSFAPPTRPRCRGASNARNDDDDDDDIECPNLEEYCEEVRCRSRGRSQQ